MRNKTHPTDDHVLNLLINADGVVGNYVAVFPGKDRTAESPKWLENWFSKRAAKHLADPPAEQAISFDINQLVTDLLSRQVTVAKKPATLLSIWPHYFRGFRATPGPINLNGKLIVIDGRNSSGKTSLAEAFEWLFSGQLVRRSLADMGDPKELENCIGNQLKPDEETTWVEASLLAPGGEVIKVRRVLTRDYGDKKTATAESDLYVNDTLLSKREERIFLDDFFAGVPPVLMQHSLRTFVCSDPSQRRNYFERLLRLDELAYLTEKSVIGDARLPDFSSSTGSVALKAWEELKNNSQPASQKLLKSAEKLSGQEPLSEIDKALREFARLEFGIGDETFTLEETRRAVESVQQQKRESGFPLLEVLRPQKKVDPQLLQTLSEEKINQLRGEIESLLNVFEQSQQAAERIGDAQIAVALALEGLSKVGIVLDAEDSQTCPLCAYEPTPTLTRRRIDEIAAWQPAQQAAQEAKQRLDEKLTAGKAFLHELVVIGDGLIPTLPQDTEWENAVADAPETVKKAAAACRSVLEACIESTRRFAEICSDLSQDEITLTDIERVTQGLSDLPSLCPVVIDKAGEYLDGFTALDNAVGAQAREDPHYNQRDTWLLVSGKRDDLLADLKWEKAKRLAQRELEKIREALLSVRDHLIEARRIAFSDGMTNIWSKLRSDRYSTFKRLFIPPPRGRGLPLEIEVKAELDDGQRQVEVDALRVFSESQINILGLAAFATRSRLLGHRLVILDDPVQSMDEDHFKTFCTQLLPELLIPDGQVIILTHNDTFAREVSYAASHLDDYVTMQVRHSRREGCVVEEGNRRVAERLKKAEHLSEEGKCDEAWIEIRKAIERLYTITYKKYGPQTFNPLAWLDQTAEYMWDDKQGGGVGPIIEDKCPGMGERLKEILSMTAGGAHDKAAKGSTDIENAIKDLKKVLIALKVGG